jgi:glycosidase
MNYPIMEAITGLLDTNTLDVAHFAEKVEGLLSFYPRENAYAMYIPVDSHDTERILTKMGNNLEKTRLAYLFQFAYPGAPAIYYGDEIGLVGGKDPACRAAFLWEETKWNSDLRNYLKTLLRLRKDHQALRRGDYVRLEQNGSSACYAFARTTMDDKVVIIMNSSATDLKAVVNIEEVGWEDGRIIRDLITGKEQTAIANHSIEISLPGWGGIWLG